jgi:hypothetical protein
MSEIARGNLYGVAGEFVSVEALEAAVRRAAEAGYTRMEAYSPMPVERVSHLLKHHDRPVALCAFVAGMIGGLSGFGMCWYAFAIYYPLNIGGRPHNSWPAWIPITFEMTVLFAALSATITMLAANGLPRLHHPVFEIPHFERASRDRFFLCVEAGDPRFDLAAIRSLLAASGAETISEVPG